jgi:phthiocerol/phenolphthiocerol synthesis type-I polyketide synthase E
MGARGSGHGGSGTTGDRDDVAVIGLSCRFPGARDVEEFWANICAGVESVDTFDAEQLAHDGVDVGWLQRPGYVPAGGPLGDVDLFDAGFFGYTPREAETLDPQHRLFLEHAWWALEDAGYDSARVEQPIGVFAGCAMSTYLPLLYTNQRLVDAVGYFQLLIGNDKDYLATRTSYKLDLTGPSVTVQTACSTGLVAVVQAARSLAARECGLALAGASTVRVPERSGHFSTPGGIHSPDGRCRPFDALGNGTVFANGVGVVVLKRLRDALRDGDTVRAVVRGGAINNDGAAKVGFTAPSLTGQRDVVRAAHLAADVAPDSVTYVEAHGTGTALGDPIEIAALTEAFRTGTQARGFCAIGAVKANVGHLDPAAGTAGFVKTVLAVQHGMLPPAVNYERPNPEIDFPSTPFYVNTELQPWNASPRRAGVSAFGIGGTNAHVVLEERPRVPEPEADGKRHLLPLSARDETALAHSALRLADHLAAHPEVPLGDVANTLQRGRRQFGCRRTVVAVTHQEAVDALRETKDPTSAAPERPVVFLFPGQGAQHVGMARSVLREEPVFAAAFEECVRLAAAHGGGDLRAAIDAEPGAAAEELLARTAVAQPALFAVEFALATLWQSWGVEPAALLGHSLGEYVAATVSGVMGLEDAVALVTARGRIMQEQPRGTMLAVSLAEDDVRPLLPRGVTVATVNEPTSCVVSGPTAAVRRLARKLDERGVTSQQLKTSHAFHSAMMDGAVPAFAELASRCSYDAPRIPFVSDVTGRWIDDDTARDPAYWASHLREPVRFAHGVATVFADLPSGCVVLEVGPGQSLGSVTRRNPSRRPTDAVVSSLPHARSGRDDHATLLEALGQVWSEGAGVNWDRVQRVPRRRVSLPGYPFQRARYWGPAAPARRRSPLPPRTPDVADWFSVPQWVAEPAALPGGFEPGPVLVGGARCGLRDTLVEVLRDAGTAVTVATGSDRDTGYRAALETMRSTGLPRLVVHLVEPTTTAAEPGDGEALAGFLDVLELGRRLANEAPRSPVDVLVVTRGAQRVVATDAPTLGAPTVEAACLTLTQEYPDIRMRLLDLPAPGAGTDDAGNDAAATLSVLEEAGTRSGVLVARRDGQRWEQRYVALPLPAVPDGAGELSDGAVVLVTGGLGGVGSALAAGLARRTRVHVVLLARRGLPRRARWAALRDDPVVGPRIRRVEAIESTGSSCEVVVADVADAADVAAAMAGVRRRHARVDMVVHAAGSVDADAFFGVAEATPDRVAPVWRAKVAGLLNLHRELGDEPTRWVLVSSLSAVLGGLGFAAYAAGNAVLDAYATAHDDPLGVRWLSIDWDAWNLSGEPEVPGMTAAEGCDALERILAAPPGPRTVVATSDLPARIAAWVLTRCAAAPGEGVASEPTAADPDPPANAQPGDTTPSGMQQLVATIWEDLLGVERPRPTDHFFTDLNGHSLLATQVASRLRSILGIEVPVRTVFDAPTLAELAAAVSELVAGAGAESASRAIPRRPRVPRAAPSTEAEPLGADTEAVHAHAPAKVRT